MLAFTQQGQVRRSRRPLSPPSGKCKEEVWASLPVQTMSQLGPPLRTTQVSGMCPFESRINELTSCLKLCNEQRRMSHASSSLCTGDSIGDMTLQQDTNHLLMR